ncbi:MAG: YitT family protein [Treponema sp.]|nr:YitT family protein [Treponema sp.]
MDKKAARETARQYLVLTLSGVVHSWAFDAFYAPNAFTYGGFTGISQIINFYIPFLPVGNHQV